MALIHKKIYCDNIHSNNITEIARISQPGNIAYIAISAFVPASVFSNQDRKIEISISDIGAAKNFLLKNVKLGLFYHQIENVFNMWTKQRYITISHRIETGHECLIEANLNNPIYPIENIVIAGDIVYTE